LIDVSIIAVVTNLFCLFIFIKKRNAYPYNFFVWNRGAIFLQKQPVGVVNEILNNSLDVILRQNFLEDFNHWALSLNLNCRFVA
jgi:hypothetical protein